MASWKVTEQAVEALQSLSNRLGEQETKISNEVQKLVACYEENEEGLGVHAGSIASLLDEMCLAEREGGKASKKLQLKLERAASIRKKVLDTNNYVLNSNSNIIAGLDQNGVGGHETVTNSRLAVLPEEEVNLGSVESDRKSFLDNLEDADLFVNNRPGDYHYLGSADGKSAWGSLKLAEDVVRNPKAQLLAGGVFREATDDGGHLIGTRFAGSAELENIDAQNKNLNRGGYKTEENSWAASLEEGNQVFVNVETYKSNGSDRPSAFMGYKIEEDADGNRSWDAFSFTNVSSQEQKEWEELDALYDELEMKK